MSRFRTADGYVSHKGFAHLPEVGDSISGEIQLGGSIGSGNASSRVSGISDRRISQIQEGDLVTGTINIAHERVHMLSTIQEEDRAEEKKAIVCVHLFLTGSLT